jgi:hypothetical protein
MKRNPVGVSKTNQEYRRAMGLPLRYDQKSYDWCLESNQMTVLSTTSTEAREWTKEEMMAYLDWRKAEDDRIEARGVAEIGENPPAIIRKGNVNTEMQKEQCIVVKL